MQPVIVCDTPAHPKIIIKQDYEYELKSDCSVLSERQP